MSHTIDMTGQRFGKLTVIEMAAQEQTQKGKGTRWRCLCDCGKETVVQGVNLRRGQHQSCGCARADNINRVREQYRKHDPDRKKVREPRQSIERSCVVCGSLFTALRSDSKYCCRKCANKARSFKEVIHYECPYNKELDCTSQKCNKCGWNPEVAKARMEAMGYGD